MKKAMKSRKNSVDDLDQIKRRKSNGSVQRKWFFTRFEDLPNDVLYEIFEYLDLLHVYQSFFDLNSRFEKLFTDFKIPMKGNIDSMSKSTLERYYTDMIHPHHHEISSLRIRNFLSYNLDISPHRTLSRCIRLRTLVLENIPSNYLENILQDIASLPNLSTLVLLPIDSVQNANDLFLQMFRLPALKYCKVSFANNHTESGLLSVATNQFSSIEQLVIKDQIDINDLHHLLSYVPQLRRLSLDDLCDNYKPRFDHRMVFNHLTHLFLNLTHFRFDELELLIKRSFPSVEVFHLRMEDRIDYVDAARWEKFISSYMSSLRVFDIHCRYRYVRSIRAQQEHEHQLNQFTRPFWFKRKWFFDYEDYFRYGYHYIIFYSTNPYRQKVYRLEKKSNKDHHHSNNGETNFSSIRHIHIFDEEALVHCTHHFPNATDLILENISFQKTNLFIDTLNQLICLQNLTKLVVECEDYSLEKFIELLSLTPNLETLKIQSITFNCKDLPAIENSETFRSVSNNNKIRNLIVKQINRIEQLSFLLMLCPQLQQLTIQERWERSTELIRLLFSKHHINTRHLFSLCISSENKRLPEKLDTLIQGGNLLRHYFIQSDYPKVYLWW